MKNTIYLLLAFMLATTFSIAQVQKKLEVTIQSAPNMVSCYDFTPDGKWFVTGSKDGSVKLWSSNGILCRTFPSQFESESGFAVAISPDGSKIAISYKRGVLQIWGSDGKMLKQWNYDKSYFYNIKFQFSYDGTKLYEQINNQKLLIRDCLGMPQDTIVVENPNEAITNFEILRFTVFPQNNIYLELILRSNSGKEYWFVEYSAQKKLVRKMKVIGDLTFSADGSKVLAFSFGINSNGMWDSDATLLDLRITPPRILSLIPITILTYHPMEII